MKKVLSIGNCGYDDSRIGRMLVALGTSADRAADATEAKTKMGQNHYGLILINRIFDSNGASGIDFVSELKKENPSLKIMLVSDYPDAQASAISNGALPGFGKSQLSDPDTHAKIKQALADES